jgi:hypothetical protein
MLKCGIESLNREPSSSATKDLPLRHEVGDLSRLGIGERNPLKAEAREGRASGSERVTGPGRGGAQGSWGGRTALNY